jgi:para-aminobenzoate synthetase / 4-amino-4-deoxychorismate lyase
VPAEPVVERQEHDERDEPDRSADQDDPPAVHPHRFWRRLERPLRHVRQATWVHIEPLGAGPPPDEIVRRLAGRRGLVCLWGAWAGGGALIACDPVRLSDDVDVLHLSPGGADAVGGGWFGFVGYDPGCTYLGFYESVLRWRDGEWWFEALADRPGNRDELVAVLDTPTERPQWTVGEFGGADQARHLDAVERAIELIRAGQLYQVNVCTRLGASFAGTPAGLFADAAARLRPAYGAYVDAGDRAVVSMSPELFLRQRGDLVTTSPIKGTALSADALRRSAKDAAENVMIVDLMRNDLSRVARTGTVHVSDLLSVEPHPGVWHLVSTVTARVDADGTELLRATFPPGSVTGAPKLRAMRAIADLEAQRRAVYTGAVGFASPSWGMELSVAIRTFEITAGTIELGVGGGITADSVPVLEWRECLDKAAPLLGALGAKVPYEPEVAATTAQLAGGLIETILAVDGVPLRLADHLARLDRSCRELYGHGVPADLAARVRAIRLPPGRAVIRLTAPQITFSVTPAGRRPAASDVHVVTGRTGLWRHKWAERRLLAAAERDGPPLFVADDGTVLETSRGNVFLLDADGLLTTPPLRDDLLPGVTRRALLDLARDLGRPTRLSAFTVADMTRTAAFWTSSISGIVPIASVDGHPLPRRDAELAELAIGLLVR